MPLFSQERKDKTKESTGKAWGGVRAGFGRTRQKLLAATGRAEQTVDLEYDFAEDQFEEHRALLEELHDDAKNYLNAAQGKFKLFAMRVFVYKPSAPLFTPSISFSFFARHCLTELHEHRLCWHAAKVGRRSARAIRSECAHVQRWTAISNWRD